MLFLVHLILNGVHFFPVLYAIKVNALVLLAHCVRMTNAVSTAVFSINLLKTRLLLIQPTKLVAIAVRMGNVAVMRLVLWESANAVKATNKAH